MTDGHHYVDGKMCPVCGLVTLKEDFNGTCPRCGTKDTESMYSPPKTIKLI